MPEKRSATGAASPTWAMTASASAASAWAEACTKPPGGGEQRRAAGIDLRTAVDEDLAAVHGQPGDRLLAGERAERLLGAAVELAAAVDGDVEPVAGGDRDARLTALAHGAGGDLRG